MFLHDVLVAVPVVVAKAPCYGYDSVLDRSIGRLECNNSLRRVIPGKLHSFCQNTFYKNIEAEILRIF